MMMRKQTGQLRLIPMGSVGGRAGIGPFEFLPGTAVTIGRSADCQACLPDPSVSRRHAALSCRDGCWSVTDLGSRHGTFLNGVRLPPNRPMPAADGDLLRAGPLTFRMSMAGSSSHSLATTNDAGAHGAVVEQVPDKELDSLAQRRLSLMIEGSAAIHRATGEAELARAVVDLLVAGTGFPRAAMLRYLDSPEQVEVVASYDQQHGGAESEGFTLSQSLLLASAQGQMARLTPSMEHQYGQSIDQLGIATALCAPLIVDSAAVGAIYLDSRVGESPVEPDAVGFCHAVSQIAGLALSSLKRAELENRQRRLEADLQLAQKAQAFLLPAEEGVVGGLRYAVRTCPGRTVAGDLFDIFSLGEDRVGICCGDVTGQGVGAAIMMTAVLSHLRAALAQCADPAAAVGEVNAYITRRSPEDKFVTLWVGVFDGRESVLKYVDAGHGHWTVIRSGRPPAPPGDPGGMLAGVNPDYGYESERLEMAKGDRLVLYSDGIIEHMNSAGKQFGRDRLLELLGRSESIESDVVDTLAALREFIGVDDLADDTTVASIEVCGDSPTT